MIYNRNIKKIKSRVFLDADAFLKDGQAVLTKYSDLGNGSVILPYQKVYPSSEISRVGKVAKSTLKTRASR